MILSCALCHSFSNTATNKYCNSCQQEMRKLICPRNQRGLFQSSHETMIMMSYQHPVSNLLVSNKKAPFHHSLNDLKKLIDILCQYWASELTKLKLDIVCPIPRNPSNQLRQISWSAYLAQAICKNLINAKQSNLIKFRRRAFLFAPQKNLNLNQRHFLNGKRYKLTRQAKKIIVGKRILLVDDLITSGHSMSEAMNLCKQSEVMKIHTLGLFGHPLLFAKKFKVKSSLIESALEKHILL